MFQNSPTIRMIVKTTSRDSLNYTWPSTLKESNRVCRSEFHLTRIYIYTILSNDTVLCLSGKIWQHAEYFDFPNESLLVKIPAPEKKKIRIDWRRSEFRLYVRLVLVIRIQFVSAHTCFHRSVLFSVLNQYWSLLNTVVYYIGMVCAIAFKSVLFWYKSGYLPLLI